MNECKVTPDAPSHREGTPAPQKTGIEGIALMHEFEGYAKRLPNGDCEAYPDPGTGGAPWTIGWGSTTDEDMRPIKPGAVWSMERAEARFKQHLGQFEREVKDALGGALANTAQEQFDAIISFTYNVGGANLRSSTLLRKHKAGDHEGAANEFVRWNKAGGRVMNGLTRRREAEAALYRRGMK
ncbi:MAG: lysozyme [Epibacterium sp.]|nr:lysozyme [Epibacterium sp.]